MIPQFPQFKKLELQDRIDIEKLTSQFEPYSDFNFIEMWSWNLNDSMEISELHGNLIIQPNDYFTDDYSLSYLGNNRLNDTLDKLFAYMELESVPKPVLKFVPEVSLHGIDLSKYLIEIDIDNCDYVYDLEPLSKYELKSYNKKRLIYNSFLKRYPGARFSVLTLDGPTISLIENLSQDWLKSKDMSNHDGAVKEQQALKRFLESRYQALKCYGVYDKNRLIAHAIFSDCQESYAMCHFFKSDSSYTGLVEYLMKNSANELLRSGLKFLNYQEDLGLPGLRFSKNSYKPSNFLRKYTVRPQ